ncbi:MAG: ribonuclease HII [Chloroflexota bacterium]
MTARFDRSLLPRRPDLCFEQPLWQAGWLHVCGIDEAGRGALAGPVAAAAVILPADEQVLTALHGVDDSKRLTPAGRDTWAEKIRQVARAHGIGFASSQEIDAWGIVPATRLAMQRAIDSLVLLSDHLLLDCIFLPEVPVPQTSLIKGDCRSLSIAAASILAKTARDASMRTLDMQFPAYGFATHKGYGTSAHRRMIAEFGPSAVHRKSFHLV